MKLIHNTVTFSIAFVGFIGGFIWAYNTKWDYEPIILMAVSLLEIIAFLTIPKQRSKDIELITLPIHNSPIQNVEVNIVNDSKTFAISDVVKDKMLASERNLLIESKKDKIGVLFIDDDKNFNVVKILKDSGWKNTKSVIDVKSIDIKQITSSEIIFVDINGVGKILKLEYEGLDLALMLKQKYSEKKVIIYSANKTNNTFHEAWDLADAKLEKNALPYQFQNLVENFSLNYYN